SMYNLALLYNMQKKKQKAIKYFVMALEYGDTDALIQLIHIYRKENDYENTKKYYLLSIDNNLENIKSYNYLINNMGELKMYFTLLSRNKNDLVIEKIKNLERNKMIQKYKNKIKYSNKISICVLCQDD